MLQLCDLKENNRYVLDENIIPIFIKIMKLCIKSDTDIQFLSNDGKL